jgi:hypothetical protein
MLGVEAIEIKIFHAIRMLQAFLAVHKMLRPALAQSDELQPLAVDSQMRFALEEAFLVLKRDRYQPF